MALLKIVLMAIPAFVMAGVLFMKPCCTSAEPQHSPATPGHIWRSNVVQQHYLLHAKRLERYYESLLATLKANAPDLLPLLDSPKPLQHGYNILPNITADAASTEQRPRARSIWYSWPWTDNLIDGALKEIVRSAAELQHATTFSSQARRRVYEKLAHSYRQIRERQQNIDAHIQYNRLWQAAIASKRSDYDRQTLLHDAVLERQTILDALAPDGLAFNKALGGFNGVDSWLNLAELKSRLTEREKLLASNIHAAIEPVSTPTFVRVEHQPPHLWIFHVPVYTDINDHDFVRSVKDTIEKIWYLRDGDDEFRVELAISFVSVGLLYAEPEQPRQGDEINAHRHVALFPPDGAILTTGALTTHVYGRAIILGPHDITRRVLAHEFGHILGFRDTYFRGYKDLGQNGFHIMEVVAEPNDIMGAPGTGLVLRNHFERILESLQEKFPVRNSL